MGKRKFNRNYAIEILLHNLHKLGLKDLARKYLQQSIYLKQKSPGQLKAYQVVGLKLFAALRMSRLLI